ALYLTTLVVAVNREDQWQRVLCGSAGRALEREDNARAIEGQKWLCEAGNKLRDYQSSSSVVCDLCAPCACCICSVGCTLLSQIFLLWRSVVLSLTRSAL